MDWPSTLKTTIAFTCWLIPLIGVLADSSGIESNAAPPARSFRDHRDVQIYEWLTANSGGTDDPVEIKALNLMALCPWLPFWGCQEANRDRAISEMTRLATNLYAQMETGLRDRAQQIGAEHLLAAYALAVSTDYEPLMHTGHSRGMVADMVVKVCKRHRRTHGKEYMGLRVAASQVLRVRLQDKEARSVLSQLAKDRKLLHADFHPDRDNDVLLGAWFDLMRMGAPPPVEYGRWVRRTGIRDLLNMSNKWEVVVLNRDILSAWNPCQAQADWLNASRGEWLTNVVEQAERACPLNGLRRSDSLDPRQTFLNCYLAEIARVPGPVSMTYEDSAKPRSSGSLAPRRTPDPLR